MRFFVSSCILALVLAGCGEDPASDEGAASKLQVVATTPQAADLARGVAGDRAEVRALIPIGADPHDYDLRPSDVDALARADVVIRSGGDLDEWLGEALESAAADAGVVTLIDHVKTREGGAHHDDEHTGAKDAHAGDEQHAGEKTRADAGEHAGEEHAGEEPHAGEAGEVDPHWWHDPRNAGSAVAAIGDALATADARRALDYRRSAGRYAARIDALDTAIAACVARVPRDDRKLVTTHDALGYYADRYGFEIVGAVIPSRSTQAQASAGETAELVKTIRRERVRAIFAESSINPRVQKAIAREAGARVGDPLYSDTLGPAGSPGETYLEALGANTTAIVEGLTGQPANCKLPA